MNIAQRLATTFLATAVLALSGCASTGGGVGAGQYLDDTMITAKVKASIFNEPTLKASEINVETYKGDVQLSGFVSDPGDASKAVQIAKGVKGVASVKNDVRVK